MGRSKLSVGSASLVNVGWIRGDETGVLFLDANPKGDIGNGGECEPKKLTGSSCVYIGLGLAGFGCGIDCSDGVIFLDRSVFSSCDDRVDGAI